MRVGLWLVILILMSTVIAVADPPSLSLEIRSPEEWDRVDVESQSWIRLEMDEPTRADCRVVLNPSNACECEVDVIPQQPNGPGSTKAIFLAGCWCDLPSVAYMEVLKPEGGALVNWKVVNMTVAMNVHVDRGEICAYCTVDGFELADCVIFFVDQPEQNP